MPDFRQALSVNDLPPGGGAPVTLDGLTIALFNAGGRFYAVDNACPHRGAALVDGALNDTRITCPLHRWTFDLAIGENPAMPDVAMRRYPVEVRDGVAFIDIELQSARNVF